MLGCQDRLCVNSDVMQLLNQQASFDGLASQKAPIEFQNVSVETRSEVLK